MPSVHDENFPPHTNVLHTTDVNVKAFSGPQLLPQTTGAPQTGHKRKNPNDDLQLAPKIARLGAFPLKLSRAVRESVYSKLCYVARRHEYQLGRACQLRSNAETWCKTQLPMHAQAASQFLGAATKTAHGALAHIDSSASAVRARWPGQARIAAPTIRDVPEQIPSDRESVPMSEVKLSEDFAACEQDLQDQLLMASEASLVIAPVPSSREPPCPLQVTQASTEVVASEEVAVCDANSSTPLPELMQPEAPEVLGASVPDAVVQLTETDATAAIERFDSPVHGDVCALGPNAEVPRSLGGLLDNLEDTTAILVIAQEQAVDADGAGHVSENTVRSPIESLESPEHSLGEAPGLSHEEVPRQPDDFDGATSAHVITQERVVDVNGVGQESQTNVRAPIESSPVHGLGVALELSNAEVPQPPDALDGAAATFVMVQEQAVNNRDFDVVAVPGVEWDNMLQGHTPNSPAVSSALMRLQRSRSLGGA